MQLHCMSPPVFCPLSGLRILAKNLSVPSSPETGMPENMTGREQIASLH